MQPTAIVSLVLAAALGWAGATAFHASQEKVFEIVGQDKKEGQDPAAHMPAPITDKHKLMQHAAGEWNCTIYMSGGPGTEPMKSKGSERNMLTDNGRWLLSQFEGEIMGEKFQGYGAQTWNSRKGKFTMAWLDSMSEDVMLSEGDYDATAKTWTFVGEMVGHDGKPAKTKMVTTVKDKDHHTFEMFGTGPDGSEGKMMWIEYERAQK